MPCLPLGRPLASVLFGLVLAGAVAAVSAGGVFDYLVNAALCSALTFATVAALLSRLCCGGGGGGGNSSPAAAATAADKAPAASLGAGLLPSNAPSSGGGARTDYLDNLKVLLTALVVNHHAMIACGGSGGWYLAVASGQSSFFGPVASFIGGMDQVYFMSLFFFISGVFVPNTFDKAMHVKKTGRLGFLSDKFYRLGVPFVCYLYGFGPLLDCFVARVAVAAGGGEPHDYAYNPSPGPPWFLAWLLVFCCGYALVGGDGDCAVALPAHMNNLLLGGLGLGCVQAVLIVLIGSGTFVMMPLTIGSLPLDIAFFVAGCCASSKRRAWLTEGQWDRWERPAFYGTCWSAIWMFVGVVMGLGQSTPAGDGGGGNSTDVADRRRLQQPDVGSVGGILALVGLACTGWMTVVISIWMVATFRKRFNYSTPNLKLLAGAAYAVYLIHPWVVTPLTALWIYILHAVFGVDVRFPNGNVSSTDAPRELLIWAGYLFVGGLSQLLVWPLAHCFRKLPLVRNVL